MLFVTCRGNHLGACSRACEDVGGGEGATGLSPTEPAVRLIKTRTRHHCMPECCRHFGRQELVIVKCDFKIAFRSTSRGSCVHESVPIGFGVSLLLASCNYLNSRA
jgi:hypothetical protein